MCEYICHFNLTPLEELASYDDSSFPWSSPLHLNDTWDQNLSSCIWVICCFHITLKQHILATYVYMVFPIQAFPLYFTNPDTYTFHLRLHFLSHCGQAAPEQISLLAYETVLLNDIPGCQQPASWNKLAWCRWPNLFPSCSHTFFSSTRELSSIRIAYHCCTMDLLLLPQMGAWSNVTETIIQDDVS